MLVFSPWLPSRKYMVIIISCSILPCCGCFLISWQVLIWAAYSWILMGIRGGCWRPSHHGNIQDLANEPLSLSVIFFVFSPHFSFLPTHQPNVTPLGCLSEQHTTGISSMPVKLSLLLTDYCGNTKWRKEQDRVRGSGAGQPHPGQLMIFLIPQWAFSHHLMAGERPSFGSQLYFSIYL